MLTAAPFTNDPVFPHLHEALDPSLAGPTLADALKGRGVAIESLACTIERSRIKQGRKALFGLRLIGQLADGRPFDQRAMLTLYPGADPALLPDVTNGEQLVPSQLGPATLDLPKLGGKVWFFPNDRKIHQIASLLDSSQGECEVLHYVPEQGCTVRCREPDGRVLIGKCRADDRGAIAACFSSERFRLDGALRLARIVDHDPQRRIVWQRVLAGTPLNLPAILADPQGWSERIATALHAFHNLPTPTQLRQLGYTSASETIARRIERTALTLRDHAGRLQALAAELKESCPEESSPALAHGDLHPGNLLWDGTSFALIDLDTVALAPRTFDHGTLAASLVHKAIESDASDEAVASLVAALRNAARPEVGSDRAYDWALAASLLGERLYRCATRLKTPSLRHRERLIEQAQARIACHA